jgi:SAM-dependent methyltransferase
MQAEQFRLNFQNELEHWWFVARRHILRSLVAQVLPPSRQRVVVDVGCGTGANIAALAEDYTCVGIDPSDEAIELARSRFHSVRFIRGEAPRGLGDAAAQANLFMLTDVLEHVENDVSLFSDLAATASPGAYFLLTVPADWSLWSKHDESHGHYRRYDAERFAHIWHHLPVEVLMVSYFNAHLYGIIRLVRTLNRLRDKSCGAYDTDVQMPSRIVNRTLQHIFQSETKVLSDVLHRRRRSGYRFGVSLIGLLRKENGTL